MAKDSITALLNNVSIRIALDNIFSPSDQPSYDEGNPGQSVIVSNKAAGV